MAASMSLLRIAKRMILGIDVHVDYAACRAGVIRGCPPGPTYPFHPAQFFQRNASPVLRRSRRTESSLAFPAILITKNSLLALAVASQTVWTE
jgi:hypothetical protein